MGKSIEFHGKTVDDAVAKALAELGLEREDISVEIIERGRSGFLGFGASDAIVRVAFEGPEEEEAPAAQVPAPAPAPEPAVKEEPEPAPAAEGRRRSSSRRGRGNAARNASAEPAAREKRAAAPVTQKPADPVESTEEPDAPAAAPVRAVGTQAEQTEAFLSGLLEHMGVRAEIEITPRKGGGLNVNLSGSGIGAVIGRRGETLDAIQHLTNYTVNRGGDKHSHINVDAENYRAKREESLQRLAEKMAAKAIKYKRSMALEPMNSYERHVIHAALQDYEGVTTSSIGSEPNRRVVVAYVPQEEKKADDSYQEWC